LPHLRYNVIGKSDVTAWIRSMAAL
jgi:hypothetical protein